MTPFAPHQSELDKLKALRRKAEQANALLGWPVLKGGAA